jgi:predicted nuclease of restriction endonuclease-like (RecB) superfamily
MDEEPLLPAGYGGILHAIRERVRCTRTRVQLAANAHLIHLYWSIGSVLVERSRSAPWGSGVLTRLAQDLRAEFPEMKGFSATNLKYMRQLATAWPDQDAIGQHLVDRLPWGHVTVLLGVGDATAREWYARSAAAAGWSRNVLRHNIRSAAFERQSAAPTNFSRMLDADGADLAQQMTRDPYVLDFLAVEGGRGERGLEDAMTSRIAETLRELGDGFAFVGRQVHFEVEGSDFFVDLLFFHVEQLRYVVVELETGDFRPENVGQLSFTVTLVDDRLRRDQHAATVGLLLVAGKNDAVVRYALGTSNAPVGVASHELLPPELQRSLPTEAQLRRALLGPR